MDLNKPNESKPPSGRDRRVRPNVRHQRRCVERAQASLETLNAAAEELARGAGSEASDRTRHALRELRSALRSQINGVVPGASFN